MIPSSRTVTGGIGLAVVIFVSLVSAATADSPALTSVLVLHSEMRLSPAIMALDTEIRSGLQPPRGAIRFYTEYLDVGWFPDAHVQNAVLEVLRRKYIGRKIDLVVAVGPPALRLAVVHGARLFPGTPMVFAAGLPSMAGDFRVPPELQGTWLSFDWVASLEAIVRLHPDTERVAIVHGSSPFDRAEATRMRQAFASYRQLKLVDLTELSYQDLLQRVAALPPRTVVLFFSFLRDRTGEVFVTTDVLRTLTRVGRVPIHVVGDTLVAAGGLGGHVVSFAAIGRQTVALAKQALSGAAPDAASEPAEATSLYMFDARALKRWGVAEGALPAGSVVIHREESIWQRYRWPLVAGIAFVVFQSTLITTLLLQRRQRALAQAAQARSLNFERLVSEISTLLSSGASAEVDAELPDALRRVARQLGFDRASLFEFDDFDDVHVVSSAASGEALPAALPVVRFPWTFAAVKAGGLVQWPARRRMSTAAEEDRKVFAELGIEAFVCIPLSLNGRVVGALALAASQPMTEWAAPLIERARLLGEVLGNFIVRRRTERAVRESEARFRLMADSAPVMVWMAGVDGGHTYFSKQWLEFTGRRLEDELGTAWMEDIHPDDRAQCLEIWQKRFEGREEFVLEYRLRRRDGEYRWVADRGVPRFSSHGTFHGYVGGGSDITELKAAHEALLETVRLRGEIFGSLYGHVAAVDHAGRIIAVNESWSASLKEEGVLRPPVGSDYLASCRAAASNGNASAEHQQAALQTVLDGRARRVASEYVSRSSHDERWWEMTVEPFHRSEGGAIVTHIDITRRRRAEAEARREREQLAHALRVTTLGELAASLAHEIHQPLAAILSNAQAARLVLDRQAELDSDVRDALVDIVDDAKRAALVIRRLRALFLKDESVQRKPVDVNAIIVEVISLVRGELELKRVDVGFDPGPVMPLVFGDAIQLQQVILNVILNASEAMVGADTPRPEVGVKTIHTDQGTVEIIISDRGPGVAEAQLERIFEPFVTTKRSGLGMGLSISRSIAQAHGGRIWATRRAGGGLTVNFELPCEEQAQQP